MIKDLSGQAVFMGVLTAFVGFASAFAVLLQGLSAVGASPEQAASGLMAASIAAGACGIILSASSRLPVSGAWSIPGSALLVATGAVEGGFAAAVGAFIVCGALVVLAGLWKPLMRAVLSIPAPLANAMLAGILVGLCFAPFKAIAEFLVMGLAILGAWTLVGAWRRIWAVPAALIAFDATVLVGVEMPDDSFTQLGAAVVPQVAVVSPVLTVAGIVGIGLPLFVVTMASHNIPGLAVMQSNGYPVHPRKWFRVTGLASMACAPFCGHAVNLAAITAAMCAGPDAHENPARRYWAAIIAGACYGAFGLLSGVVASFVTLAPAILIQVVAGLALIPAFAAASVAAFKTEGTRGNFFVLGCRRDASGCFRCLLGTAGRRGCARNQALLDEAKSRSRRMTALDRPE